MEKTTILKWAKNGALFLGGIGVATLGNKLATTEVSTGGLLGKKTVKVTDTGKAFGFAALGAGLTGIGTVIWKNRRTIKDASLTLGRSINGLAGKLFKVKEAVEETL